ncbi:CcoG/RdxA/FixG family protein [Flaviaesturariibacter terrae]
METVAPKKSSAAPDQSFRDSIATVDKQGHRRFIFPKKPKGRLYNKRTLATIIFLVVFFTLPLLKVGGEPLFLFNVVERKFIFFGQIFWPQDFFIFAVGFLTFMVFVILFTVVFGRVFCGWACPQTVFMEMVFRKIEYWLDGDAPAQKRLAEMPWNGYKIRKRAVKIAIFYGLSFIIGNFALAYVIGMDNVLLMIREGVGAHPVTFAALIGFTTTFFFVFYWFREQACLVVCPYGRLQGVLLDRKSMVVAYDYVRGEPRGKVNKTHASEDLGDCIDCAACVRVCPTGIDIRNGTQLECVNCTACIDACDAIMRSLQRMEGLIRIDSEENIARGQKKLWNARTKAYSGLLLVLVGVLVALLVTRTDVDATVLRTPGQIFQTLPDGRLSNIYTIKFANKTRHDLPMQLKLENMSGEIQVVGNSLVAPGESYAQAPFFVKLQRKQIERRKTKIVIGVYEGPKRIKTVETTFFGPGY